MKAVVLLSGGMDSTTLLHYVVRKRGIDEVYALAVCYGQRHARELEAARWQSERLPQVVARREVDLTPLGELTQGASSLTDATLALPALGELTADDRRQPPTYVPNRNLMLLSLAAAWAESCGCATVFYGAQAQDEYGYWDCTTAFVERLNAVLALNRKAAVTVEAPFAEMRKADELRLGLELGVDYSHTWTCYRGTAVACGTCPSCRERLQAFAEVGVDDPLPYATMPDKEPDDEP